MNSNNEQIRNVALVAAKIMDEALKGNQHKIDANKNGKVDAEDFKILRGEKKMKEEVDKDTYGAQNVYDNEHMKAKKGGASDSEAHEQASKEMKKKYPEHTASRGEGQVYKLPKQESVELEEGRMKDLAYDLDYMNHHEFHKTYGHPKHHYDPLRFKKPVQKGHEMDRAKALAQRGIASVRNEEVEQVTESTYSVNVLHPDSWHKSISGEQHKKAADDFVKKAQNHGLKAKVHNYDGSSGGAAEIHLTHKDPKHIEKFIRKHYDQDDDLSHYKIHESVEQIDELSKDTLGKYITRNADDQARIGYVNAAIHHDKTTDQATKNKIADKNERQGINRDIGLARAVKKLTKEEQEFIDELNKSTLGSYINASARDAVHRTAQEVETGRLDKLADKRMKGIKLATKKLAKEETVDEAITKTSTGYIHHARPGVYGGSEKEKHVVDTLAGPKKSELEKIEKEKKMKKFSEMLDLINTRGLKALSEMIKEEPDNEQFTQELKDQQAKMDGKKKGGEVAKGEVLAVKQEEVQIEVLDANKINGVEEVTIDERHLSEPEMEKREKIVKSMKKGLAGFKQRYGERAKSVMYATATKQAKGE